MMMDYVYTILRITAVKNQGQLCKPSLKGIYLMKSNFTSGHNVTTSLTASSLELPMFIQNYTGGTAVVGDEREVITFRALKYFNTLSEELTIF